MKQYLDLLQLIVDKGVRKQNRTGIDTLSIFGHQMRFDLSEGFPLVTTKKIHLKSVIHELLWIISGDTNIKYLNDNGVKIWNDWAATPESLYKKYRDIQIKNGNIFTSLSAFDVLRFNDVWLSEADYISRGSPDGWNKIVNESNPPESRISYVLPEFYEQMLDAMATDGLAPFEWRREVGDLGPVYGSMWRSWPTTDGKHIDQLKNVIERIKQMPDCRRLIVSAWNPEFVPAMALPPCHSFFQFGVSEDRLNCHLLMRSVDVPLGMPFNIASYALLTMMIAQECGLKPGDLILSTSDTHIYVNQLDGIKEQLTREPRALPKMILNPDVKSVFDFKYEDFTLEGYDPHPHIPMPVAV